MFKNAIKFITRNPLMALFAVSLATRLFWLFFGLPSITNDEADIYTSSYIFGRTLKDYFGNTLFSTTGILTAKPSIPIYIGALPWFFTSVKSVLLAKLPFVILNSLTPVILFSLVYALSKNKTLSLFSMLVLNFSPWFSYSSATGYEAVVALFFILLFFRLALLDMEPKRKTALVLVSAFCAFNSYMGLKPIFPLILFTGLFFYFNMHKERIQKNTLFKAVAVTLLISGVFFAVNYITPNSELVKREYRNMITYHEKPKIEGMVWFERWTSTGPDWLVTLLSNKYTIRLREYASKYFLSFNPQLFFVKGDPSSLYGTADLSGLFFITDFVFFAVGLMGLLSVKNRGLQALSALMLVGGIPNALSTTAPTYILRGIVLLIPYTLLISLGMYRMVNLWKKSAIVLLIFFAVNTALYSTVYKTRIANLNGEQWKYSIGLISRKVADMKNEYASVTIYNIEPQETFFQYAFYGVNDPLIITKNMRSKTYRYKNVFFLDGCPKTPPATNELVVFNRENCGEPPAGTETIQTIQPLDRSGKDYFLFRGI